MRRLLPILLAVALLFPGAAMAKGKKAKAAKANVPEWAVESEKCSGDRDVKSVSLGKEVVYVNEALNSVSFTKNEMNTLKHNLVYKCPNCDYNKRTPGVCKCGGTLVPSFKHGETWYKLDRDVNGNVLVEGAPAIDPSMAPVPAPEKKVKKAKKARKGKKAKKAKKVEETKEPVKEEVKDAAPAAPAADEKK